MDDYVLDHYGNRVYPGDYVQCLVDGYASIRLGQRRRVLAVKDGYIILPNNMSPRSTSPFRPDRFRLSGRYHPYHHGGVDKRYPRKKYLTNSEKQENAVLHIAVLVKEGDDFAEVAARINDGQNVTMIADRSQTDLKSRLRQRIQANPDEHWLILSGNTIAEISCPPVRFRSV